MKMVNFIQQFLKTHTVKVFLLFLAIFLLPKTSFANDVFRVTDYKITSFSGTTYNLNLNNALAPDHFILIKGAESGNVIKSPTNSYVKVSKLPSGANKSLPTTGSNQLLELKRYAAGSSSWVGVVTVVECLVDCDVNGFRTLDVLDFTTPSYTSTTTRVQSGTATSSTAWTNINKVVLFGSVFGAGSNVESATADSGYYNSAWTRLYPSGTNTLNWQRYNGNNVNTLSQASHVTYVIQFGSAWNIQRVNVSGAAGGAGSNATGEYNTGTISSVTRANTWVWGTGYSQAAAVGNGSEGVILTLGNGVASNATETTVAVGSQNTITRSFDVYTMTHPNLAVAYNFIANGNAGTATVNVTTTSRTDTLSRFAYVTKSLANNTNIYPTSIISSRYTSNTNIALEREYYPASTSAYAAWVQGVYTKNIQYIPTPTLNQDYYRFRDDTKTLNENNGWVSATNTNPQLFTKNINYRVRFAVSNSGETDTTAGKSFKMQYGLKTTANCSDITTWTDLTAATGIATIDSLMYTNQDPTSMLFTNYGPYTFLNGYAVDTVNLTNSLAFPNNRFSEFEYSFKVLNSISDGKYCLRLYNSTDSKVLNYSVYPEVNVGNYLVQDYYRWYQNSNSINPVTANAIENTECFVSVADQARLRLNLQSQLVPLNSSTKQFKVQYSKSSLVGPWSDVGAISTVSNWWNKDYANRKKINFGTSHSLLPAGYTVSFTTNTQIGLSSGDDIRVVFQKNTGEFVELDRIADVWNSTTSKLEFRLQSDVLLNANDAADGSYYIYYGNSAAVNPPTNKNKIYFVYDDFSDSKIRNDWKTIDNDKTQNTNFSESSGTLNINAGGIDTWEAGASYQYDDYGSLYQDNISGDFDLTVRAVYQDNTGSSGNAGIMLKNDITQTQANSGYFTAMTTIDNQYMSAWDSTNNGYLDTISYTGSITWPSCLRIVKTGTIFNSYYSNNCTTFTKITTQTISTASSTQDIGIYVMSSTGNSMSLGKFNLFKLLKYVATAPTITFGTIETKNNWEFYDNASLTSNQNIVQSLLSNSNVAESYSEINPTSLNPNTIAIDQRGEYDFSLISKNASKGAYYFRVVKSDNSLLDLYNNYPKISVGSYLALNSYRWYQNSNSLTPGSAISTENSNATINSLQSAVRLRLNISDSYQNLASNSEGFILQYSKGNKTNWIDVGSTNDWAFYDNNLASTNSSLSSSLLSSSTVLESYSEQNPTAQNINPINNNQIGEYDFSLIPSNASDGQYYFRIVRSSNKQELESYLNYPSIIISTKPTYNQYAYRLFSNADSVEAGYALSNQNSPAGIKLNGEFRLKMLMSISGNVLTQNKYFKLQYAEKGTGTCASPQYAYSVITSTSPIVFKDNASLNDNISIDGTQDSLTHAGFNIIKQSYKEQGDFSNNISYINIGNDGQWDFSLKENNNGTGKTYCLRIVNEDESLLDTYSAYPEVNVVSGVLAIDIVDQNGLSISNPVFNFSPVVSTYSTQTSTGVFGNNNSKIRITNTTPSKAWTASIAPTNGPSAFWLNTNGIDKYYFNNADANQGNLTVNPSLGVFSPQAGHTSTGLSLGSVSTFINGVVDSITLATASNSAESDSYWDLTNIGLSQTIPVNQKSGDYSINMTITIIGN